MLIINVLRPSLISYHDVIRFHLKTYMDKALIISVYETICPRWQQKSKKLLKAMVEVSPHLIRN